jgi:Ca2+/Na+ antiporter
VVHLRKNSSVPSVEDSPLNRSIQKEYGTKAVEEPLNSHSHVAVAEDGEDEEEEEEEEFWHLTDSQLKYQAFGMLLIGTAICTVFSDPLVDTISQLGVKMGVSPFYISFVVTPLASNASEIIASLMFARKRTTETISLTLATLHGAATMNSTLALCVFMCLVYFQRLSWAYTAECICVFTVIFLTGIQGAEYFHVPSSIRVCTVSFLNSVSLFIGVCSWIRLINSIHLLCHTLPLNSPGFYPV